jgi:monoamine oxidase
MEPQQRVQAALAQGAKIHRQYPEEFLTGVGVAWSRMPWTLGCCSMWAEEARKLHYKTLTTMEGRLVLAGEHASHVGCWQEGALLSAISAITQLHERAVRAG